MSGIRSTRQVARLLGVNPNRISRAVWEGRIEQPEKGPGGAFFWTEADVRRAAWVLRHRDLDDILAERKTLEAGTSV